MGSKKKFSLLFFVVALQLILHLIWTTNHLQRKKRKNEYFLVEIKKKLSNRKKCLLFIIVSSQTRFIWHLFITSLFLCARYYLQHLRCLCLLLRIILTKIISLEEVLKLRNCEGGKEFEYHSLQRVSVRERVRELECVWVRVRERVIEKVCEWEKECVCACMWVCVVKKRDEIKVEYERVCVKNKNQGWEKKCSI